MTRNHMHPHHNNKGLTLVELLVAMAMATILSVALVATFASYTRTQTAQENVISMQQNLRAALYLMGRDLRMAGYRGPNPTTAPPAGIDEASADSILFSFLDDDTGNLNYIKYDFFDSDGNGTKDIIRRNGVTVAEDIDGLEFFYTIGGGTPTKTTTPTPGEIGDIRSVEITLLASTNRNDKNFSNTSSYPTASGASWDSFNDGRRRRLGEGVILFRNM